MRLPAALTRPKLLSAICGPLCAGHRGLVCRASAGLEGRLGEERRKNRGPVLLLVPALLHAFPLLHPHWVHQDDSLVIQSALQGGMCLATAPAYDCGLSSGQLPAVHEDPGSV